jgi:ATP-dependent DNA helicase RecG
MRDYGYLENLGMGVRLKIVKGMIDHNGKEPGLVEEEERFTVTLYK